MTRHDITCRRRIALLADAERSGRVVRARRSLGASRTRFFEGQRRAEHDGLSELRSKGWPPSDGRAAPTHVVEALLDAAETSSTLGCRQLGDRLGERRLALASPILYKTLVALGLGIRRQRLARASALTEGESAADAAAPAARTDGPWIRVAPRRAGPTPSR